MAWAPIRCAQKHQNNPQQIALTGLQAPQDFLLQVQWTTVHKDRKNKYSGAPCKWKKFRIDLDRVSGIYPRGWSRLRDTSH